MPQVTWRTSCRLGVLYQRKASYKPPSTLLLREAPFPKPEQSRLLPCGLELVPASSQPLPSAANPAHLHVDRACHHGCWGQLKLKKREEIYAKLLIAFVCNEIIQYSSDYRI